MLASGLYHCEGGPGPNTLDVQAALERWVEQGKALETIMATKYSEGRAVMTRALCVYPKRARYAGTGDLAQASSFPCVEGARYPDPLPAA